MAAWLLLACAFCNTAQAAVQVEATRVIYNGTAASAAVGLSNKSGVPYLVQAWLDHGDPASESSEGIPMALAPPLMRLGPGEQAVVRAIYSGRGLPADRESLLWLNLQEIPPLAETENVLQIAIRTRIKLFYRPKGLRVTLETAARDLQWKLDGTFLHVTNNGPLHVTFTHLQGLATAGIDKQLDLDMIAPGQTLTVPSASLGLHAGKALHFGYINDFGGITEVNDATVQR